jgi:hypothetical protein
VEWLLQRYLAERTQLVLPWKDQRLSEELLWGMWVLVLSVSHWGVVDSSTQQASLCVCVGGGGAVGAATRCCSGHYSLVPISNQAECVSAYELAVVGLS